MKARMSHGFFMSRRARGSHQEPKHIRFQSARICIYFVKSACNICILLHTFSLSILNPCSNKTASHPMMRKFLVNFVGDRRRKVGLSETSYGGRRKKFPSKGLCVWVSDGYWWRRKSGGESHSHLPLCRARRQSLFSRRRWRSALGRVPHPAQPERA